VCVSIAVAVIAIAIEVTVIAIEVIEAGVVNDNDTDQSIQVIV